jgi:KipI family sensor histidine kinase inhibitor
VGDAALTVELGRTLDPELNARVRALDEALSAHPFDGLLESVPAYASLLCVYDPARASFGDARAAIQRLLDVPGGAPRPGSRHVVPVRYGGENGPDLAEVARARRLSEREVIQRHTAAEYTALFVGFLPGFAYLGTLAAEMEMPRRAAPGRLRPSDLRGHRYRYQPQATGRPGGTSSAAPSASSSIRSRASPRSSRRGSRAFPGL